MLHAAAARVDGGPRYAKHKMGKETTDAMLSRAEALALLVVGLHPLTTSMTRLLT